MFCPKCGTDNPADGKFCRKCGTGLAGVSQALQDENSGSSFSHMDPTGLSGFEERHGKRNRNPDDLWASGLRTVIMGFGFLAVSIGLLITGVAGGRAWWWAMLIPAFSMLSSGISNIVKAERMEKRRSAMPKNAEQGSFPKAEEKASLPPKQTDYVSPSPLKYETGDLVPSSVVENTTRHLEMDSEGKTMTLPKSEK